tara:strand:+ start:297 stop:1817 length:1521 start_codon:yes stop_codon:yes gene_type:complete
MANTTETATFNVDSNIGEVGKDAKEAAAEFKIMGVSLNSVKKGFASAKLTAKGMFGSIKAGLISTGIGAFVVLIGSLLTFFTKTKKGAELLEVAFAGIGAAISVITDRVSKFGGAIVKLFKGDVKGALTDVKGAFTGIGTEIANDTKQAIALKQAFIALRDSERELNVETAQRRADIEELKLIAEDVTKTEKERLEAAEKAFKIENDLLNKRVANAEEAVRIQKVQNNLNESLDEDLDALAQKEIELANIRGESVTKQIELNNKINSIKQETINKNEQLRIQNETEVKATQDLLDKLQILRQEDQNAKELLALLNEKEAAKANARLITDAKERNKQLGIIDDIYFEKYLDLVDKQSAVEVDGNKKIVKSTTDTAEARLAAFSGLANALSGLAGDNKELAAAGAIIDTYAGANKAFQQGGVAGFVTGAAIIAAGLNNVNRIYSTPVGTSGNGGGTVSAPQTPAPQMMSGAFELSGGVAPDPVQAFVVTDEMTNSQNQLANIRRRATI